MNQYDDAFYALFMVLNMFLRWLQLVNVDWIMTGFIFAQQIFKRSKIKDCHSFRSLFSLAHGHSFFLFLFLSYLYENVVHLLYLYGET